jgi:hypothetical protein
MPVEYYQIPKDSVLEWDELGFKAYCADIAKYPDTSIDEAMVYSWHRLFFKVALVLHLGDEGQARDYAWDKVSRRPLCVPAIDPQLYLRFPPSQMEK